MALDFLYQCLDLTLAPEALLDQLIQAIAQFFDLDLVYLDFEFTAAPPLMVGWTNRGELDWSKLKHQVDSPRLYPDIQTTPYRHFAKAGIKAIACVPIPYQHDERGWLWLGSASTLPSLETIETVLPPLSLVLQTLELQGRELCCQAYHQLIAEINHFIDEEENTTKLLKRAIAATQKFFQVDQGIVGLLKYDNPLHHRRDQITCPTATITLSHSVTALPKKWQLRECDFCQQAWLGAPEIWHATDTAEHPWNSPLLLPKNRSLLIAPLMGRKASDIYGNTILGFLVLAQQTPRLWQTQEIQVLKIIAHQLSTTMIHHQALRQVQSLVDERTAQLKWSLDVQAKLGAKMRQQIQQLRQLNVLKDEFLSTMSHELNTPLATMKMAVKMLKQPGRSPEKQATYLDILDQELLRESKLIQDLLKLQHFESEKFALKPQRLVLQPIIQKIQKDFNNRWNFLKGIKLEFSFAPENISQKLQIETDEESLTNALSELLVNAGKYSTPDSTIHLDIEYFPKSPAWIQIRICNDGSGIAPEEQEHIFEKFRRGAGVTDNAIPGTGLGLALVKALIEQLEGTIEVSSEPNEHSNDFHTCFTLILPQTLVSV